MKPFKMDKWGQIPLAPKAEGGDARWSIRLFFVALIVIVVALVFIIGAIQHV